MSEVRLLRTTSGIKWPAIDSLIEYSYQANAACTAHTNNMDLSTHLSLYSLTNFRRNDELQTVRTDDWGERPANP